MMRTVLFTMCMMLVNLEVNKNHPTYKSVGDFYVKNPEPSPMVVFSGKMQNPLTKSKYSI